MEKNRRKNCLSKNRFTNGAAYYGRSAKSRRKFHRKWGV